MKKQNYIVRFSSGPYWVDLTMPREALKNPRIFARWFRASCKRYEIDIHREMPACSGISRIAADYGYRWHDGIIPFARLYWGK